MGVLKRFINFVLIGLIFFCWSGAFSVKADETVKPEVRALWVDAFRDGIKTPEQVDRLIQDSLDGNINTLIVQVRRRGDAYYNNSLEPRTEDPDLLPGFDALQDIIDKAHAKKIEVHAWLNTLVACKKDELPQDPNHVWNLHGPEAKGRDNWVSYYRTLNKNGKGWSKQLNPSFYLDPGHPDLVDYTVDVHLHVVKNYDIDGIHLDYSRYAGMGWGYNPTSVARYNARYGTAGMPAPDDPQWAAWRREQTAGLVRKIYLKAIALKPRLKVSSAVVTWGDGPITACDWEKTRAYTDVFQDWRSWLEEGIIDQVMPMNYFSEWNPKHQYWYDKWIEWEKNHQYGRQIVIGPGVFTQYIEQSLEQIRRAKAPSANGNYGAGVALFSYGASHAYSNKDFEDRKEAKNLPRQPHPFLPDTNNWLFKLLSKEGSYPDPVLKKDVATQPIFPTPVGIPDLPWKSNPTKGYMMGTIAGPLEEVDHLKVKVESVNLDGNLRIFREVYSDGSGWFGLAELPPGEYWVSVDKDNLIGATMQKVLIQPGRVSEVVFIGGRQELEKITPGFIELN
jgi:uncharacterized lipoprotein YddW (UPF0748 family)